MNGNLQESLELISDSDMILHNMLQVNLIVGILVIVCLTDITSIIHIVDLICSIIPLNFGLIGHSTIHLITLVIIGETLLDLIITTLVGIIMECMGMEITMDTIAGTTALGITMGTM
jgi:hypothetical protein